MNLHDVISLPFVYTDHFEVQCPGYEIDELELIELVVGSNYEYEWDAPKGIDIVEFNADSRCALTDSNIFDGSNNTDQICDDVLLIE